MRISVKTAAVLSLALLVGGCDAGAQLAAAGAVALFGLGAAAISESAKNQETYCQSGSQIYTQYGGCGSGQAISSEEYQRLFKERAEKETESKIAAADAARSAKTYRLSNISQTPYIAASGECQPSDQGISEDQYRSTKEEQFKSLTAPPSQPINDKATTNEIAAANLLRLWRGVDHVPNGRIPPFRGFLVAIEVIIFRGHKGHHVQGED
jgi:hypothetical protein